MEPRPSKPTRIIRPPELVKIAGGRGNPPLLICCDDGREYTTVELARVVGCARETLRRRLKDHGWQSAEIFKTTLESCHDRMAATARRRASATNFADGGNSEWARLGLKTRSHNLKKRRPPGTWERQLQENSHDG